MIYLQETPGNLLKPMKKVGEQKCMGAGPTTVTVKTSVVLKTLTLTLLGSKQCTVATRKNNGFGFS